MPVSVKKKKKKKKRISKLWILGRKEGFCFLWIKKKKGWKQTLSPPTPPPVEGRIQVHRREGKKDAKRNGGSGQRYPGKRGKG